MLRVVAPTTFAATVIGLAIFAPDLFASLFWQLVEARAEQIVDLLRPMLDAVTESTAQAAH